MIHTLITLLGKAQNNYRQATYVFDEGVCRTSRFFSLELCRHIQPDKLVVLGTTGSMWDSLLLETELGQRDDLADDLLNIGELARQDAVEQSMLDELAQHLTKVLTIPCELKLIPYGRTQQEQTDTLEIMVDFFEQNDTATLDVTHGLRHLPMLVQQSALLLQTLKDVRIAGIYYGALDLTQDDLTPVMQLQGLLEIDRWSEALSHYDRTGDYGAFVPLLESSGLSQGIVDNLREAAFYEQTNNTHQARGRLRKFLKQLAVEEKQCSRQVLLFMPALKKRFLWVEEGRLHERQGSVARLALENGDLLRASIYGFEAFITLLTQQNDQSNPDEFEARQAAKELYEQQCPQSSWRSYKLLRDIRNQLAHSSTQRNAEVVKIVSSRARLTQALQEIFSVLIPK